MRSLTNTIPSNSIQHTHTAEIEKGREIYKVVFQVCICSVKIGVFPRTCNVSFYTFNSFLLDWHYFALFSLSVVFSVVAVFLFYLYSPLPIFFSQFPSLFIPFGLHNHQFEQKREINSAAVFICFTS